MCVQKAVAALMTTDDPNTNMKILCATRDQKRSVFNAHLTGKILGGLTTESSSMTGGI